MVFEDGGRKNAFTIRIIFVAISSRKMLRILFLYSTAIIIIVFTIIYTFFKYRYNTWKRANVPYIEPEFPYGNSKNFSTLKESMGDHFKNIYNELKTKTSSFGGIFTFSKPQILLIDPELIKTILTKDFGYFLDRGGYIDEEVDPLNANLVFLTGQRWKNSRTKITPAFTSGKMKMLFNIMLESGEKLRSAIDEHKFEPIDIKNFFVGQATDVIASCAFGLECNSLKEPYNDFIKHGKRIFTLDVRSTVLNALATICPSLFRLFKIPLLNPDVAKFFFNVLEQTIAYREKNNVQRKDFLDLLIKLKNKQSVGDELLDAPKEVAEGLSFNELAAHAFAFYAAGVETTSSTVNFCFFEIASNLKVQENARREIWNIVKKHDGKLTYEGIMEMKYVEKIVQEVLRKYPPIPILQRECTKDYQIPNSNYIVRRGTEVIIPTLGLHRDSQYYHDPDKFDPERFSEEEKSNRHSYVYLPFGEGPRNCIGMRFALLNVKIVLCLLLMDFKFKLDPKTESPIIFDPRNMFLLPKDKVWLQAERIQK